MSTPPPDLISVDSRKINDLSVKLSSEIDKSNLPDALKDNIKRLIAESMDTCQALHARMTLDSGFRGMGANILIENAGRLTRDIRNLGKTIDRIFVSIDPTALDPVPNRYQEWRDANRESLRRYSGMTIAFTPDNGIIATSKKSGILGFKEALQAAKDAGYAVNTVQVEFIED